MGKRNGKAPYMSPSRRGRMVSWGGHERHEGEYITDTHARAALARQTGAVSTRYVRAPLLRRARARGRAATPCGAAARRASAAQHSMVEGGERRLARRLCERTNGSTGDAAWRQRGTRLHATRLHGWCGWWCSVGRGGWRRGWHGRSGRADQRLDVHHRVRHAASTGGHRLASRRASHLACSAAVRSRPSPAAKPARSSLSPPPAAEKEQQAQQQRHPRRKADDEDQLHRSQLVGGGGGVCRGRTGGTAGSAAEGQVWWRLLRRRRRRRSGVLDQRRWVG